MCNALHSDARPIPKEGRAWKLVLKGKVLRAATRENDYEISDDGWVYYNRSHHGGDGFCALPTREEACYAQEAWNKHSFRKSRVIQIKYRQGRGGHIESHFVKGYDIHTLIIGAFKPI